MSIEAFSRLKKGLLDAKANKKNPEDQEELIAVNYERAFEAVGEVYNASEEAKKTFIETLLERYGGKRTKG